MGKLKSAWEIAQEKADRLGKLSAEEIQRHREQECRQIGQAIAQRYLDSPKPLSLDEELNKHQEERDLVKQAILTHLTQAIDLKSWWGTSREPTKYNNRSAGVVYPRLEKIAQGIASLEPKLQPTVERIRELAQEYERLTDKARRAIEIKCRETLHQLRISGTAVGNINIEAASQWQQSCHRLAEPFETRLDSLKRELINRISSV